ncbi:nuclear transport factor 2 family protein [Arthrobacter sp. B3I4]|uniref:nuclear transport factor 2 family protein n=1 Tax=Arthrobacter sp. B3I4 TaxID=3042267 RepID=UPI00278057DC|nr:nuclear transport factor 2 family protein [Arthrobacter sp. B3I4]MDQ0756421.1 ketosteroid isomerase-like protein [Arthrobacter sp. B3I4]
MTFPAPLECVLGLLRAIETGGGAEALGPFLAGDFVLTEAPHLLAPQGSTRNRSEVLDGAERSGEVVSGQRFEILRSTCEGGRVVVEAEWSATAEMDLPYWDRGDEIRARTASVFEVLNGRITSQHSYDCYYQPA